VIFYVDRVPPDLKVYNAEGRFLPEGGTARTSGLKVLVSDNLSDPESLEVRYRVDGGRWMAVRRGYLELSPYGEGYHRVEISVKDEFNLETRRVVEVVVPTPKETWGCTLLGLKGSHLSLLDLLGLSLLLSGWMLMRRRRVFR
jgi:hypothetical protein